ncbi:hypothetical protein DEO48_26395, partial [Enterobacter sp. CGMCC 5087]
MRRGKKTALRLLSGYVKRWTIWRESMLNAVKTWWGRGLDAIRGPAVSWSGGGMGPLFPTSPAWRCTNYKTISDDRHDRDRSVIWGASTCSTATNLTMFMRVTMRAGAYRTAIASILLTLFGSIAILPATAVAGITVKQLSGSADQNTIRQHVTWLLPDGTYGIGVPVLNVQNSLGSNSGNGIYGISDSHHGVLRPEDVGIVVQYMIGGTNDGKPGSGLNPKTDISRDGDKFRITSLWGTPASPSYGQSLLSPPHQPNTLLVSGAANGITSGNAVVTPTGDYRVVNLKDNGSWDYGPNNDNNITIQYQGNINLTSGLYTLNTGDGRLYTGGKVDGLDNWYVAAMFHRYNFSEYVILYDKRESQLGAVMQGGLPMCSDGNLVRTPCILYSSILTSALPSEGNTLTKTASCSYAPPPPAPLNFGLITATAATIGANLPGVPSQTASLGIECTGTEVNQVAVRVSGPISSRSTDVFASSNPTVEYKIGIVGAHGKALAIVPNQYQSYKWSDATTAGAAAPGNTAGQLTLSANPVAAATTLAAG